MKEYQSIQIDGVVYDKNNIDSFPDGQEWQLLVKHFLNEWFNTYDFIEAYTSGSTGVPKNIKLLKSHMVNSANATIDFFKIDATDTILLGLPASYIAGKMMLVRAMVARCNIMTVSPSARPFEGLNASIAFAALTPYQLYHSIDDLSNASVKTIIVGGAPVSLKLENMLGGLSTGIYETFGMTETCSHIALRGLNGLHKSEYFSTMPNVHLSLNSKGCLVIHAPDVCSESIITNDIVELINAGSFKWLGRSDNVINSGALKIFPEQVEKKIAHIFDNRRFFIASLPDDKLGQKLILVIESEEFNTVAKVSLDKHLKTCLEKHELPKGIFYVSQFKISGSGKILKNETLEIVGKKYI